MQKAENARRQSEETSGWGPYLRFGAMITTSTAVMYALTYTNLFSVDHARWSEERGYMAVLMGSAMAVVMVSFMWSMYPSVRINVAIVVGAIVVGGVALTLSQTQALVRDEAYLKGMTPHHSIAILTSERAGIEDLRVRELADGISQTQVEEIKEMDWLLDDIAAHGKATTVEEAQSRPVPDFADEAREYLSSPLVQLLLAPLIATGGEGARTG